MKIERSYKNVEGSSNGLYERILSLFNNLTTINDALYIIIGNVFNL